MPQQVPAPATKAKKKSSGGGIFGLCCGSSRKNDDAGRGIPDNLAIKRNDK